MKFMCLTYKVVLVVVLVLQHHVVWRQEHLVRIKVLFADVVVVHGDHHPVRKHTAHFWLQVFKVTPLYKVRPKGQTIDWHLIKFLRLHLIKVKRKKMM